jgi:hypothetical protein
MFSVFKFRLQQNDAGERLGGQQLHPDAVVAEKVMG